MSVCVCFTSVLQYIKYYLFMLLFLLSWFVNITIKRKHIGSILNKCKLWHNYIMDFPEPADKMEEAGNATQPFFNAWWILWRKREEVPIQGHCLPCEATWMAHDAAAACIIPKLHSSLYKCLCLSAKIDLVVTCGKCLRFKSCYAWIHLGRMCWHADTVDVNPVAPKV